MEKYTFHVEGMHCKSCVLLTERELGKGEGVVGVKTDLAEGATTIEGDFGTATPSAIIERLNPLIASAGYRLFAAPVKQKANGRELGFAAFFAFVFVLIFAGLQQLGLINLIGGGSSYGTIFTVGIVASLSSCMAVVGGLVLSLSASFAKSGQRVRPLGYFHVGRIAGFFLLGGVLGALGGTMRVSATASFIIALLVAFVMFVLGMNLLDVFPWARKLQFAPTGFLGKHALAVAEAENSFAPLLLGAVTFFLPCGFTQSMQMVALSTGSFVHGALTMFTFALGTLPTLALLSFGAANLAKGKYVGVVLKTAGIVVMLFALYNLHNALVAYGLIHSLL